MAPVDACRRTQQWILGGKLNPQQRQRLRIGPGKLTRRATAVWVDWAKKAGVRNGDIVVSIDGLSSEMGIKQLQTWLQMNKDWGDTVAIEIIRNGKRADLSMKLPVEPRD